MKYFVLEDDTFSQVLDFLIHEKKLPSIQSRLNIYAESGEGILVEILNNSVYFRDTFHGKNIYVKNKNLKHFFRHIQSVKDEKYFINDIELLKFDDAILLFDTYHGNILSTDDEGLVAQIEQRFNLQYYDDINQHPVKFLVQPERLFDEIGNLNQKIKKYSDKTALDIRSSSSSMRLRLANISNDYSPVEKYFKLITGSGLLDYNTKPDLADKFENISIIIPTYQQNVLPTLLSIQGQNLSKKNKKKIQVVLIDDGSDGDVKGDVEKIRDKLDYELTLITLGKNMGIASARNVGLAVAKYDLLLFMDSDIILSKNYLYDVNIRMQILPNAIFVAMRKNVEPDSDYTREENLLKGIERSLDLDDSRVITRSKEYHIGWDKAFKNDSINVLDDTDFFKQLGFGSKLGIYDLSSVVTGHNIAVNRAMIKSYPVFSNKFTGWGMEDTYFASSLISRGCYVIPLLSSCVFHINHPPRSGSMEQKIKEANKNYKLYNDMLDAHWE